MAGWGNPGVRAYGWLLAFLREREKGLSCDGTVRDATQQLDGKGISEVCAQALMGSGVKEEGGDRDSASAVRGPV